MHKLVVVIALVVAACGTTSVSLEDYPSAFRDAHCSYLVKCGAIEDIDTCRRLEVGVDLRLSASTRAAIEMGTITFDEDNAGECVEAVADRSCDRTSESSRLEPQACRNILIGTLRESEACTDDAQCVSQECSRTACNTACCVGMCVGDVAPARAKAGEPCVFAACDDASVCDQEAGICIARKPRDAFCGSSAECAFGLDCDRSGTCTAPPTLGQPCTGPCRDEGTTCGSTGTCVEVALAGETCETSADCTQIYRCDTTRRCVAGAAVGAPCTPSQRCGDDNSFCEIPDGQGTGTCVLPKPDGEPCRQDAHCQSDTCDLRLLRCGPEPVCT